MRTWIAKLLSDEAGSGAVIFGMTFLPFVMLIGASIDISLAYEAKVRLQATADQAALAAVLISTDSKTPVDVVRTFLPAPDNTASAGPGPTATVSVENGVVTVDAAQRVPTKFAGILGVAALPIAVRSSAAVGSEAGTVPICILALNPTAADAVLFTGNTSVVARRCSIYSNSSNAAAISLKGSATVQAAAYCAVGGTNFPSGTLPVPRRGCPRLDDPFRNLPLASGSGCRDPGQAGKPNKSQTLDPGDYCSLDLKGTVTLNPGFYFINGPLTISAQATVTGRGVTLYLTGSNASFRINGGASVDLSATTTGPYAGIVLMQDRQVTGANGNVINGGADVKLVGAIYAPRQAIDLRGNGSFGQQSDFMPIIADTITFTGNTTATADATAMQPVVALPKHPSGGARVTN
ncbi:TadE/TadG family type IV pilus assembly protein [Methylobacterium oryzisoli]|uniref:TadE/TadG family type IV pilus assembly protein n=1 Tax=Methylobacterium oryzisoli TaxID=3385502 RepID=UPI0038927725